MLNKVRSTIQEARGKSKEELVKYKGFLGFWWEDPEESWFRRWRRRNKAVEEGIIGFYTMVTMLLGLTVITIALYKGRQKSSFREQEYELKLKEMELEIEALKLKTKLAEVEDEE